MSAVTFELREQYADSFEGGSVSPDGRTVDLGKALKEGHGQIVVDPVESAALVDALDNLPSFKRAGTSEDTETTVDQLEILKPAELRELASRLDAKPQGRSKKALITAIREAQSARQEG